MFVSASHELSQEYREFERCSTVAANAYIGPSVRHYIGEIDDHIRGAGFGGSFLIVQSTGGLLRSRAGARAHCVRMLESGPAAGVIGTQALCHTLGLDERHRVRHGRHHGEGRRHLRRRGADHRRGADRRLRSGVAGADRHDGYLRGRHRRRLDRAGRGRRAARRAAQRGRGAGPRLLRARRHASRP